MIRLERKDFNMIFTNKLQKYQHYPLEKLVIMNALHLKKYYLLIKVEWFRKTSKKKKQKKKERKKKEKSRKKTNRFHYK